MKTLGLVGGTGWISTIDYYRLINQEINKRQGGHQFARCVVYSINFGDIVDCNERNDSEGVYRLIKDATDRVIRAGAQGIVLCANTLHKYADQLQNEIATPLIHIAKATAQEIHGKNMTKVGLLGTKYTMEEEFYTRQLINAGIRTIVPDESDRESLNIIIYDQLVKEIFEERSKEKILEMMKKLQSQEAEGIILGCTEIPLLIQQKDFTLTLFNTTAIHARAAVDFALDV